MTGTPLTGKLIDEFLSMGAKGAYVKDDLYWLASEEKWVSKEEWYKMTFEKELEYAAQAAQEKAAFAKKVAADKEFNDSLQTANDYGVGGGMPSPYMSSGSEPLPKLASSGYIQQLDGFPVKGPSPKNKYLASSGSSLTWQIQNVVNLLSNGKTVEAAFQLGLLKAELTKQGF